VKVVLPYKPRLVIYVTLAVITMLVIPAAGIWFTSVGEPIPLLLVRIGAIASFVAGSSLVLSILNIKKGDELLNDSQVKAEVLDPSTAPVQDEEPDEPEVEDDGPGVEAVVTDDAE